MLLLGIKCKKRLKGRYQAWPNFWLSKNEIEKFIQPLTLLNIDKFFRTTLFYEDDRNFILVLG